MINVEYVIESCTGCGACYNTCHTGSISMVRNSEGFLYPMVDLETCVNCHKCERVCMALNGCAELFQDNSNSEYAAAWALKENMPAKATSGGIASVLSKLFFCDGGHVFGAAFSSGVMDLKHIECLSEADIKSIIGSKYLQSNTTTTYSRAKTILECGEKVLYIGTPCQIAGLKKYLQKEYDNLYTIDFFCHGVPSPLAWEKYVSYLQDKYHAKLVDYNFRAKLRGWGRLEQSAKFSPRRIFKEIGPLNTYHTWFGKHLSIRSSCFQCQFRSDRRVSDITVADFWKIEQFYPYIPTKQGVSCVIINSKRGQELFDSAVKKGKIVSNSVSYDSVWGKRKTAQTNYNKPEGRQEFLTDLSRLNAKELARKYPAQSLSKAILEKLHSLAK